MMFPIHKSKVTRCLFKFMQREGDYPPPEGCPEWMGLEIAGVITEMGDEAKAKSNWKIGDKVCALLGGEDMRNMPLLNTICLCLFQRGAQWKKQPLYPRLLRLHI